MQHEYILVSYPDGQIVISSNEDFEKHKDFYHLTKVGTVSSSKSSKEIYERIVYPLALHETWQKDKAYTYTDE